MKKIFKTLLMFSVLAGLNQVVAAPPYDVEITVTAPSSGGPVSSYEAFLDGQPIGFVTPGVNSFPGLLTADGSYTFRVDATNAAGTTPGTPVNVVVNEIQLPGITTITITVSCDPCTTVVQ